MRWPCLPNERRALLIVALLGHGTAAQAGVTAASAAWFAADPCPADAAGVLPMAGHRAVLSVHAHPGQPAEDQLLLIGDDAQWRAPYETWTSWTPLPPQAIETDADGQRWAVLRPDDSIVMRHDACTAELWIDANPQRVQHPSFDDWSSQPISTAARGGYLNLDSRYGGLARRNALGSLIDLGAFGTAGSGRSSVYLDRRVARRLDSYWLIDDPERLQRLRLGDAVTRGADWEAPVRYAGIQWGTEFALQPDRITFPLPSIAGSAALASTAQLYVNGVRQARPQPLEAGAFRFDSVPTLTGSGELSVTLRDALGREQTISQPFYASPRLLAAGLREQVVEAGFLREDYAGPDDRYTRPLLSASLREGLSDHLTVLLRGGATPDRQLAGSEFDRIVPALGLFSLSAAMSNGERGVGGITSLAFERIDERFSLSLRHRIASRDYADFGRAPGSIHFSDAARLSWRLPGSGTASLVYIAEQPWAGSESAVSTRLAGLGWSQPFGRDLQAYASWLHALDHAGSDSLVIGLTSVFGRGSNAGLQYARDSDRGSARASAQHAPDGPLGLGWRATADADDRGLREAEGAWATSRGTYALGYAGIDGRGAPSATAQTAFAFVDGRGYWSRPIRDSFAVVDTGGVADVRVLRENQLVGRSDASGHLLLTDLQPFQRNRLAIDDRDLPIALGITEGSQTVAPPAGAGIAVRFAVDARPMQRLRLVDERGVAIPVGAALWLGADALSLPVGYHGLIYGDFGSGKRSSLSAQWPGGSCVARLPASGDTLRCVSTRLQAAR